MKTFNRDIFAKTAKLVDPFIFKLLTSHVKAKYRSLISYQVRIGGKRFRPALTLFCCRLLKGNVPCALKAAAAIEILHNYTLISDDIIDKSQLRRNQQTVWKKFGPSIAECVAVDYIASLLQYAGASKEAAKISELLGKTLKTIVEGQIADLLLEHGTRIGEPYIARNRILKISKKAVLDMMAKKTAVFLQTCCVAGGICANASKKILARLGAYGFNLGMAFQIADDISDLFENGQDITEKKGGNVALAYAYEELSATDRATFARVMEKNKIGAREVKTAQRLIQKTRALKRATALKNAFLQKARKNLEFFPNNAWKTALENCINFLDVS